jgi:rifampin ADP-ribosylating transferase
MTEPANDATSDLFYHGTRADLAIGDVLKPGFASNYGAGKPSSWVYFTATLDAAIWGAELAAGAGRQRIYIVEPLGAMVDDPNLTDKKFPGNPTRSYRTQAGLRITGEVEHWQGHAPERVEAMKENLRRLKEAGVATIID